MEASEPRDRSGRQQLGGSISRRTFSTHGRLRWRAGDHRGYSKQQHPARHSPITIHPTEKGDMECHLAPLHMLHVCFHDRRRCEDSAA
jgi:hypothetical protein